MSAPTIDELVAVHERKSRKAAQLFALLRDPDVADIVALLRNGASSASSANGSQEQHGLRNVIRSLYPVLGKHFTSNDVVVSLQEQGFDFGKRNPKSAVRDQLYALSQPGLNELKIVSEGKGGKPNIYEVVGR